MRYCGAAFCLHSRPYRESSAIVQLFTREHGKISAVAKGVKSASGQRRGVAALLQPFTPLQAEWFGQGELKTLGRLEAEAPGFVLREKSLFAGLYINELLNALLPEQQEYSELYPVYEACLQDLAAGQLLEKHLRRFEKFLLEQLGYGVAFVAVDEQGHHCGALSADRRYRYVPESGFVAGECAGQITPPETWFSGENLQKIAADNYDSPEVLLTAKQLMRQTLAGVLGHKPLNSRQLFS